MKVVHGMRPEDHEAPIPETHDFKICPICGATCFADMEVCFGCLHHFEGDGSPIADRAASSNMQGRPEMHRIETKMDRENGASPSETCTIPVPDEPFEAQRMNEMTSASFDHMRDIPGLKKPEAVRSCSRAQGENAQDAMTTHHICSDAEGRQFEISISVKLL